MVGTTDRFTGALAPCGKLVAGAHYRERDGEGLVISDRHYACGCRRIWHEYHDGSIRETTTRHDGRVLLDDPGPEHGA